MSNSPDTPQASAALERRGGKEILSYRGHEAICRFDPEEQRHFAVVLIDGQAVTALGESLKELMVDLAQSIDDHLAKGQNRGASPSPT